MTVRHYDWLAHHANCTPARTAWVDLHSDRSFSYAEAEDRTSRLAWHLQKKCAISKGDRVGVLAMNSTDIMEMKCACAKIGAIFLPLNWRLTVAELEFIVKDASPKVLIHDTAFTEEATALKGLTDVQNVIETTGAGGRSGYETALENAQGQPDMAVLTHDDVWSIMYTSGTTGLPKGAMNTYGMTFYNAANLGNPALVTPNSTHLSILPLFHTGGMNCYTTIVLHAGGTSLIMRTFEPSEVLRLIGDPEYGITHFFGVPANYLFLSQHPAFAETDFSRLSCAGIGGAPTPIPLLETWSKMGIALQQGYGMTETSPAVLAQDAAMALGKPGSTGKPVLHNQVRIVDDKGQDVPIGVTGELWVKGPNITPGYWNRPDATAEAITDGWLHTGDACRVDEEGHYYIVDRWKDMYISGGENVYPAEVESILFKLDGIADVAVVGVADERWGEIGCAVVVVAPDMTLEASDVIEHCHNKLARFKIPSRVEFIEELPRNATGKVLKRVLKENIA